MLFFDYLQEKQRKSFMGMPSMACADAFYGLCRCLLWPVLMPCMSDGNALRHIVEGIRTSDGKHQHEGRKALA